MAKGSKPTKEIREHAPAITDDRFARIHTDPRFLRPNREESKVVIDDRFKGLLSSGSSGKKKKKALDKYGRRVQSKSNDEEKAEMNRLYRLEHKGNAKASGSGSSSSSEEDAGGKEERKIDYARGEGLLESSEEDSSIEEEDDSESESESEEDFEGVTIGTAAARRREKQSLRFADEEDEEEEREEEDVEELQVGENDLAELDAQAERTVRREAVASKKAASSIPKRTGDTSRLAVVNMDWDHIRAVDLYKVFSSLVSPAGTAAASSSSNGMRRTKESSQINPVKGRVLNVRVYPSQFGLERMVKENQEGPPRDIFKRDEEGRIKSKKKKKKSKKNSKQDDDDSDESEIEMFEVDEGGEFDEEALRNYQLERLRYYYAIVTFDSPQTARYIMDEIDGTEMERTANVFDLSFVPEDMTFPSKQSKKEDLSDDGWRDEASEGSDGGTYKGVDFTTDALRHSKVQLTWDADDPQRSKVTRQLAQQPLTLDELRDEDFKAYLASDSEVSQEEEDEDDGRSKMRALLGLHGEDDDEEDKVAFGKTKSRAFEDGRKSRMEDDPDRGREMQITFMPGLSEAAERKRNGLTVESKEESTKDVYMRKQREKKERRRQQGKDEDELEPVTVESEGKLGFDDPFFASDDEVNFEEALAAEQEGRSSREKSKISNKIKSAAPTTKPAPQKALSREEQIDSDGESDTAGHFSIKDILKAEQEEKGKKSRWAKKKEKKNKSKDGQREHEVQENFAIDVEDERFQGVFNDHRFSLDPSHPSFIKTKSMEKLMDERRKRDKQHRRKEKNRGDSNLKPTKDNGADLADLVQSVKKRSAFGIQDVRSKKKARS